MLVAIVALASERGGEGLQEGFKGHSWGSSLADFFSVCIPKGSLMIVH